MLPKPPIQENIGGMQVPQTWILWFDTIARYLGIVNRDGSISPPSIADADADNNTIYYSTTQSKLVYKDNSGVVNDLY